MQSERKSVVKRDLIIVNYKEIREIHELIISDKIKNDLKQAYTVLKKKIDSLNEDILDPIMFENKEGLREAMQAILNLIKSYLVQLESSSADKYCKDKAIEIIKIYGAAVESCKNKYFPVSKMLIKTKLTEGEFRLRSQQIELESMIDPLGKSSIYLTLNKIQAKAKQRGALAPKVIVCYAGEAESNIEWTSTFSDILCRHLQAAGLNITLMDPDTFSSATDYTKQFIESDFVFLLGTESLAEKYDSSNYFVRKMIEYILIKQESAHVKQKFSLIPILISGDKKSFPVMFSHLRYFNFLNSIDNKTYFDNLCELIALSYEENIKAFEQEISEFVFNIPEEFRGLITSKKILIHSADTHKEKLGIIRDEPKDSSKEAKAERKDPAPSSSLQQHGMWPVVPVVAGAPGGPAFVQGPPGGLSFTT